MFVVWKRPDGFHDAGPSDFRVAQIGGVRLWLHKTNHDEYPFRVSGGWDKGDASKLLNNLINCLDAPKNELVSHLVKQFEHSTRGDPAEFFNETVSFIRELAKHPKGDTWETEITTLALAELENKILVVRDDFLVKLNP